MVSNKNVLLSILVLLLGLTAFGQERIGDVPKLPAPRINTDPIGPYPLPVMLAPDRPIFDLSQVAGRFMSTDTVGDIKTTILYEATDSLFLDITNSTAFFYTDGDVKYGPIELKSDFISLNWGTNIMYAEGVPDTTTGRVRKRPLFKEGIETYETSTLKYNFETGKAYITGAVTQQGESFLQAKEIKKAPTGELYSYFGRFTTCNLSEPHFHIQAEQIKAIPGNKLVSGPFHLRFNDIPTPLGLPFGMFPDQKKRRSSGIIFPTYGEERVRGFFIRDGGYYLALSERIHFSILGEIYSKGGWGGTLLTEYRKRYGHQGNFRFNYTRFASDLTEIQPVNINDFWLEWAHRPESKGNSRFSASVRAGTSTYNANNTLNYQNNVNSEFASSVQYQKTFAGTPFNMSANLRHSQNVRDGRVQLSFPEAAFNMNRLTPFQDLTQFELLKRLNVAWTFNLQSRITNSNLGRSPGGLNNVINRRDIRSDSIVPFNFETLSFLFQNAQVGGRHNIPVSSSFNIAKHFTVSPQFNYEEIWYLQQLRYTWNPELEGVRVDTLGGFSRVGSYNLNAGVTTRLFGTMFFKKGSKIEAMRHEVIPTLGFNYRPDYSDPRFGIFQEVQVNERGDTRMLSRYEGFAFGSPQPGRSATMAFQLENILEAKIFQKGDTTGKSERTKLIDNLSLGTAYNFLADSFALAPIRMALRTAIFDKKINFNITSEFDPYLNILDSIGANDRVFERRLDRFAWNNGQGIGRLSNIAVNLNTSLNSQARAAGVQGGSARGPGGVGAAVPMGMEGAAQLAQLGDLEAQTIIANAWNYVDFTIPWNVNLGYNLNLRRPGFAEAQITQALTIQGDLNLTSNTKIMVNSGYDFKTKEITHTTINITRDLHCWELLVNWVPFGRFTSYNVDLRVKPGMLQDLKISRRRNLNDR